MKKIFLSPSNQNANKYYGGITNEYENCDEIAGYLEVALNRCGFEVMIADFNDNAMTRCKQSKAWGADLHFAIHTNAYQNGKAQGVEAYYYANGDAERKEGEIALAKLLCAGIASISPTGKNRGAKKATFAELENSTFAAYIEIDFHDNKTSCEWLTTNQKEIAENICESVCKYYGVSYVAQRVFAKNEIVSFVGEKHYTTAASSGNGSKAKPGLAKVTIVKLGAKHPYHLIRVKGEGSTVYGWVNAEDVKEVVQLYSVGDKVTVINGSVSLEGTIKEVKQGQIVVDTETMKY